MGVFARARVLVCLLLWDSVDVHYDISLLILSSVSERT